MFTLKPISRDSVGGALAKAERYRLLNEPNEAVSICRDILEVDPSNPEAHVSMILALTDEMVHDQGAFSSAIEAIAGLDAAYDRAYYSGIAWERRAKAYHDAGKPGSSGYVYDWLVRRLTCSRRRSACGRLGMMTQFCGGMLAFVISIGIRSWGLRRMMFGNQFFLSRVRCCPNKGTGSPYLSDLSFSLKPCHLYR